MPSPKSSPEGGSTASASVSGAAEATFLPDEASPEPYVPIAERQARTAAQVALADRLQERILELAGRLSVEVRPTINPRRLNRDAAAKLLKDVLDVALNPEDTDLARLFADLGTVRVISFAWIPRGYAAMRLSKGRVAIFRVG